MQEVFTGVARYPVNRIQELLPQNGQPTKRKENVAGAITRYTILPCNKGTGGVLTFQLNFPSSPQQGSPAKTGVTLL